MRIKHRYVFNYDKDVQEIVSFLDKNQIKYQVSNGIPFVILEVFEDQSYWEEINKLMNTYGENPNTEIIYSKKELDEADWLRIRAKWRSEYPQPEDEYKNITYSDKNYCNKCGCGLIQQGNFMLKKTPSWGKRNFLMINWIEDELFITEKVAKELNKSGIRGFTIRKVDNYKSGKPLEDTYQIQVENCLKEGLIFKESEVIQENKCTECGSVKRILSGTSLNRIKSEVIKNVNSDIVKTSEKFGDGHVCMSSILINRKVYNFIKENKWDKDLYFEPAYLVI